MEKDWNERFEKAQAAPRPWRVVLGGFILLAKIGHFVMTSGGLMERFDLWPLDSAQRVGYDLSSSLLWLVAAWLIASGLQPRKVTLPPEPKIK